MTSFAKDGTHHLKWSCASMKLSNTRSMILDGNGLRELGLQSGCVFTVHTYHCNAFPLQCYMILYIATSNNNDLMIARCFHNNGIIYYISTTSVIMLYNYVMIQLL